MRMPRGNSFLSKCFFPRPEAPSGRGLRPQAVEEKACIKVETF